ncbi:15412_t:CDS:2, partial [Funneliformis geosporum]
RRPFWDRAHDTELIIDICDGSRPPTGDIVAPEGYIEIMKECWDPYPSKRPSTENRIYEMYRYSFNICHEINDQDINLRIDDIGKEK